MDFLDPKKRRAHGIRLMVGYALMAVALGIGTLILVFATSGYGFDRKTGTIIQNGLVFINAHPVAANILINGKDKGTTDGRFVLEEGNYKVELNQTGYRSWKREFVLEGGSVERLAYPFLFPQKLVSSDVQLYAATPTMVTQSPDRRWIVSHHTNTFNVFQLTDANTKDNATTELTVPTTVLVPREGQQKLTAVEWSTDNRHVLLRHDFAEGSEFVMLDRETPQNSTNLSQTLNHSYSQIALRDKRFDQIYGLDSTGVLQTADLKSKAITPVTQQVLAFFPYGNDMLLYVTSSGAAAGKAVVKLRQNTTDYTLRTVPVSEKYLLNMASFDGDQYVIVGDSTESRGYLYRDPLASLKKVPPQLPPAKALLKVDKAEFASFSGNARFVAIQGEGKFAVYDMENNRQFRYDTGLAVPAGQKATWMDGHRLGLVSDGKLNIFDFDGTNRQTLVTADPAFQPFFDRDYTALFTISPSATVSNKTSLLRTELIVKQP